MKDKDCKNITIGEITQKVSNISNDFEASLDSVLKTKYILWNIDIYNTITNIINSKMGTFGTGYPFYVLDENLEGTIDTVITEQIRYNRSLITDGKMVQKSIWQCAQCLKEKYEIMHDLKSVCKPCPNVYKDLKPRKIINRLPDLDLWFVCKDGMIDDAKIELKDVLDKINMKTSDVDPIRTIMDLDQIVEELKMKKKPKKYLPIDTHIVEYSTIKELIEKVPDVLREAKDARKIPYLPIHPDSLRKEWQKDDEAYNYIYDFLSAFTSFDFEENLQKCLQKSRMEVVRDFTNEELYEFVLQSATDANHRRFLEPDLKRIFYEKVDGWRKIKVIENKTKQNSEEEICQK